MDEGFGGRKKVEIRVKVGLGPDNVAMGCCCWAGSGHKVFHSETVGIGLPQQPEVGCRPGEYMEKDPGLFVPFLLGLPSPPVLPVDSAIKTQISMSVILEAHICTGWLMLEIPLK